MASIFLDANMLFSFSNRNSNLYRFGRFLQGHHSLVSSAYAVNEATKNIVYKRPQWENGLGEIMTWLHILPDTPLHESIVMTQKDRPVLGSAIAGQVDYLLTGDKKDFGHLFGQTVYGVMIVNYQMLSRLLLQD